MKHTTIPALLAFALALTFNIPNTEACSESPGQLTISASGAGSEASDKYVVALPKTGTVSVTVTGAGDTPCPTDGEKCQCGDQKETPETDGDPKYTFTHTQGTQDPADGPTITWDITSSTATGEYKFKLTKIEQKYKACKEGWTGGVSSKENTQASREITIIVAKVTKVDVDSTDSDSNYIKDDSGTDIIGTVKGSGNVKLKATVTPDLQAVKDTLTWTGVTQDGSDKTLATTSRSASAKKDVEVKINGTTSRQATLWIVWGSFTSFPSSTPADSSVSPPAYGASAGVANGCLIQVTLEPAGVNAVTDITYDIKRTKERGTWSKTGATWTQDTHVGPGADDDSTNTDEDLTPSTSDHIYSADYPGFTSTTAFADEAVYKASFIEYLNIKVGSASAKKGSTDYPWHSITWLDKSGASWIRKSGATNEINTGSTTVGTNATP
ncbi:MAG TPA: hypothetical protein PLS03_02850 [Terrimicrobiaceae bacterium]|nr:hypothetical protein [Terrimicrobiaceae bacterium]